MRKNYSISEVTIKQIDELKDRLGSNASETIRIAIRDLYKKEVKK